MNEEEIERVWREAVVRRMASGPEQFVQYLTAGITDDLDVIEVVHERLKLFERFLKLVVSRRNVALKSRHPEPFEAFSDGNVRAVLNPIQFRENGITVEKRVVDSLGVSAWMRLDVPNEAKKVLFVAVEQAGLIKDLSRNAAAHGGDQ